MKKALVLSFAALIALSANVVSAQGYYFGAPSYYSNYGSAYQQTSYTAPYGAPYSGACANLVSDLSYGTRGSQVSQLQTFLVNQNFPGGGSWMITGYFGNATLAAVRNFQQQRGLPLSGIVDAATRAAISRVSCGLSGQGGYMGGYNTYYPYTVPPFNTYNNTNCYYTYPYTCNTYSYGNNVSLTSLSVTSGQPGTSVTVFGSGFDYSNNTVYVGMVPLTNIPSYSGTSLTFTVPSYSTAGTVGVYVMNSRGTSNTLNFSVTSYGSYGAPMIHSVNGPTSLATGVQGTWTVSVNNPSTSYMTTSVNWGDTGGGYSGLAAPQTTYQQGSNTLTFTHTYYTSGTYTVVFTVSNSSGQTNTSSATVNVTSGGSYGNVALSSIAPMTAPVGSQFVLTGSGFTPLENTVHFGIGGTQHVPSQNGTTIYYTVPSFVSPCDLVTPGSFCSQNIQQVLPGPIQVYVTNGNGTTNTILFQVQ
ncbi:MAG: peptidoglycan-binding protein [Patescibacteria group bacterium]